MSATITSSLPDMSVEVLKWAFADGALGAFYAPPVEDESDGQGFVRVAKALYRSLPKNLSDWVTEALAAEKGFKAVTSQDLDCWQACSEPRSTEWTQLGIARDFYKYKESNPPVTVTLEDGSLYTVHDPVCTSAESIAKLATKHRETVQRQFCPAE